MKHTLDLRRYLPEVALAMSTLAIGGLLHFLVEWGTVKQALAESDKNEATVQEQLKAQEQKNDQRWSDQQKVNEQVLRSLGKIEGRLEEKK